MPVFAVTPLFNSHFGTHDQSLRFEAITWDTGMTARASWKGYLKVGELVCPVALHAAVSASERLVFHTINRKTGHRVHRVFVDQETGDAVEREDQVKGYAVAQGEYIVLTPEEVASAVPAGDKSLSVEAFIPCDQVDDVYFDRPYFLTPADANATEAYAVLREGLKRQSVAALATAMLFRRVRTLLIRAYDDGLLAIMLNFDYEVRSAEETFAAVPEVKITDEMLDLARHIIDTKRGSFDPTKFDDKYETALVELVKAKIEGRTIERAKPEPAPKVVNLMDMLRRSAEAAGGGKAQPEPKPAAKTGQRRKAAAAKSTPPARRKAS